MVKDGTGTLSLGGVNAAFTGNITVNGGTVRVTKPGSITGNLNLTNGVYEHYWSDAYTRTLGTGAGQLQITGGVSGFSENGATGVTFTLNNDAAFEVVWGSALFNPSTLVLQADTAQGASSLTLANKLDFNGTDRTIRVAGGTTGAARATISGQIRTSSGTSGLTKTGAGMLIISSTASAWNGNTAINGGVLDFTGINVDTNIGAGVGVRDITVAAGAGVRFNALSNALLNRIVETSAEIGVMTGTTANNLDFSSSTGASLPNAFLGNWASNGAKMTYTGTLTPASDNYRLGAKFSSGLLGISGTNAGRITGETAAPSPTFGGLIGSRNLLSVFSASGGNNETNLAATAVTGFTLNPGAGKSVTYSGAIANFAAGTTLTKTGAGTQVFTGTHTYTGATTITNGTLSIDVGGSINTSAVTVNGGNFRYNSSVAYNNTLTFTSGTVSGTNWTGSLSGLTIGTGQTVSPGDSPGTAATVSQTWATGGSYLVEINNATGTAGADPGWDLLSGTGALSIIAGSGSEFKILINSLTIANAGGLAANFDDATGYNWRIADFDSIIGFDTGDFSINTTNFSNPFTGAFGVSLGGVGSVPGDNSQLYLTYAPVPEPRAVLLGALGLFALLRRRRA